MILIGVGILLIIIGIYWQKKLDKFKRALEDWARELNLKEIEIGETESTTTSGMDDDA